MTAEPFEPTDLLADGEDSSSVAGMAISIRAVVESVTLRIGQLMVDGEEAAAMTLRDHAQMLLPAADLLERLYSELEGASDDR